MITQKEIEESLNKISVLNETEFLEEFNNTLKYQNHISQFLSESVKVNDLDKETESSFAELVFYVIKIYQDKFKDKFKVADVNDIVYAMKSRNDRLLNIAKEFNISQSDVDFDKKFAEIFYRFNMVISGNRDKVENLTYKEYNKFIKISDYNKKFIKEPKISEYVNIYLTTDKDISEDKKQIINSLVETIIETLNNIN